MVGGDTVFGWALSGILFLFAAVSVHCLVRRFHLPNVPPEDVPLCVSTVAAVQAAAAAKKTHFVSTIHRGLGAMKRRFRMRPERIHPLSVCLQAFVFTVVLL